MGGKEGLSMLLSPYRSAAADYLLSAASRHFQAFVIVCVMLVVSLLLRVEMHVGLSAERVVAALVLSAIASLVLVYLLPCLWFLVCAMWHARRLGQSFDAYIRTSDFKKDMHEHLSDPGSSI